MGSCGNAGKEGCALAGKSNPNGIYSLLYLMKPPAFYKLEYPILGNIPIRSHDTTLANWPNTSQNFRMQ